MEVSIVGLGNKCMDIQGANNADKTPIIIWDQKGSSNQKWNFTADNLIESSLDPSKCIDILGSVYTIGTPIVLNRKNGSDSQKWRIDAMGRIRNLLYTNMCISAGGAIVVPNPSPATLVPYEIRNGYPLVLWDINDSKDGGQIWSKNIISRPVVRINLSYKILANPVTGALPAPKMIDTIHTVVEEMNNVSARLNTGFRFRLFEEPVIIGGPNASGQVNFWYNTWMQGEHMKAFESSAKRFFLNCELNDPGYAQCDINRNQSRDYFAWRNKAVNLYVTGFGWGGISSFPGEGDFIALCVNADCNIQIHELGHFFGLGHTMGDDGIADTLVDNKDWNKEAIAMNNFNLHYTDPDPHKAVTTQQRKQVDDVWNNIMSYHPFSHLTAVLTANQLERWDMVLRNQRANVIYVS